MKLDDVLSHFGGAQETAKALGLSHQAIYAWRRTGVPCGRQYQLELLTDGALRAERPVPRDSAAA